MPRLKALVNSGAASAGAVLLPRVWSIMTQWLVAASAGTAALTAYLTTTTRGSVACALVVNAFAPVLVLRRGAMRTPGGRALVASSVVVIAAVAFVLTFAFEATLGLGVDQGIFTAGFAIMSMLGGPAMATWPVWQTLGRFVPLVAIMVVILVAGAAVALTGQAELAAVVVAFGSAVPTVAMVGRVRLRRALGYAYAIARRCVPVSSMGMATAILYPMSIQLGTERFGAELVGEQLLYWPLVLAAGITSQSIAAKAISSGRGESDLAAARRRWLVIAAVLTGLSVGAFFVFRWRLDTGGPPSLPLGMTVAAAAFIFSDPICAYFCPPSAWRTVAIGSLACSVVVGAVVLVWPTFMLEQYSVCGPSAIVAALRLAFVRHPSVRRTAQVTLVLLLLGFVLCGTLAR